MNNNQSSKKNKSSKQRRGQSAGGQPQQRQIGAAVVTRMPRIGFSDITRHTVSWIAGYVFVGDGTNGATDSVLFKSASGTYIFGDSATTRGSVPVLAADSHVGATYVSDVEKHFARKRILSQKLTVASLQPATSNNMMVVIAASRAQGLAEQSYCYPLASVKTQQPFTNVMSMDSAMTVDAWETKSMDISRFIGGGSGARQNEFEIANSALASSVFNSGSYPAQDLDGLVPTCLTLSGNSTTTALRGTNTHAIIVTQTVDYIDFVGGSNAPYPVGVAASTSSTTTTELDSLRRELQKLKTMIN